jgi:carbonic anhydrase
LQTLVLCCGDHRANPVNVLGLEPNEVAVLANPGGRVTQAFLNELVVLATIAAVEGFGVGFELIVMHHTDCGLSHLSPEAHADVLAPMFGIDPVDVSSRHLDDPYESVRNDIGLLRETPFVPPSLMVSAIVYELATGTAHTVIPPTPLGET